MFVETGCSAILPSGQAKEVTNFGCDTLGNLVLETVKNKNVDYE